MFEKTKEIIDIIEDRLNDGEGFQTFKKKNANNNKYSDFVHDYKEFMRYMIFQYDLFQITIDYDILSSFAYIKEKFNKKSESDLQFILRTINKLVKIRPMKFELYLKLLFDICNDHDQSDDHFQDILLSNINNRFLLCKLYENGHLSFEKLQKAIRPKNLLFFIFYLKNKLEAEEYDEWTQSLPNSVQIRNIFLRGQKLTKTDIENLITKMENHNQISVYIRNDDYDNFIDITSKYSISFDSEIPDSISEIHSIFDETNPRSFVNYSAFYGAVKIFRYLISNGARCDSNTLKCACAGGNSEIIRLLFQKKISFNSKCLNKAIKHFAGISMIDFIIENSNLEIGINEMHKAIKSFNFPFFTYYLSQKLIESENSKSENFLHASVFKNNFQITQFVCVSLKKYFNAELINKHDCYHLSPLIKAVSYGYLNIVKVLIENGADYKNDVDDKILKKYFFK